MFFDRLDCRQFCRPVNILQLANDFRLDKEIDHLSVPNLYGERETYLSGK